MNDLHYVAEMNDDELDISKFFSYSPNVVDRMITTLATALVNATMLCDGFYIGDILHRLAYCDIPEKHKSSNPNLAHREQMEWEHLYIVLCASINDALHNRHWEMHMGDLESERQDKQS